MTRYATIDRYAYEPDAPQGLSGMVGATRSGREYVVDPMGETGPIWAAVLEPRAGDAVVSTIAVGVSRDAAFDACERQEARLWDDGTMTEGDGMPPGRPSPAGFPACRICGCWEYGACWDDDVGACWWVEADLCSHCAVRRRPGTDRGRGLRPPATNLGEG